MHTRELENLAQISGLSYGPRADRGDANTPLAAGGDPSTHGPSWRMVVDWGTGTFSGIYPGGQSENPASSWYTNRVDTWWNGLYAPMLTADQAAAAKANRHLEPSVMIRRLSFAIILVAVLALGAVSFLYGGWWWPFIAGLAIGALTGRARVTIPVGAAVGLLAWGAPLAYDQVPVRPRPRRLQPGGDHGLRPPGRHPRGPDPLVGTLLGLTGAWLGSAARGWMPRRQPATSR